MASAMYVAIYIVDAFFKLDASDVVHGVCRVKWQDVHGNHKEAGSMIH